MRIQTSPNMFVDIYLQLFLLFVESGSGESRILAKGMPSKNFHIRFGKSILAIR